MVRVLKRVPFVLTFSSIPGIIHNWQATQQVYYSTYVRGCAVWGVDDSSQIQILSGNQPWFQQPIPAKVFDTGLDFHELYRGLEFDEHQKSMHKIKQVPEKILEQFQAAYKWRDLVESDDFRYPSVRENEYIELRFTGRAEQAMVWGYQGHPV